MFTSPVPLVVRSTVGSCITTGTLSDVNCTSHSTTSAPNCIAALNAARVFSGNTPANPRWATNCITFGDLTISTNLVNCVSDASNLSPKVSYPLRAATTSGLLSPPPKTRSFNSCLRPSIACLVLLAPITAPEYGICCAG
ncbi:hypothetical protein D3C77_501620 [compost metagenome]